MYVPKNKNVLLVLFFSVFIDVIGFGIIIPLLPFYAKSFNASPIMVTILFSSFSFMQLVFAPLWGSLSDRLGRRSIIFKFIFIIRCNFRHNSISQISRYYYRTNFIRMDISKIWRILSFFLRRHFNVNVVYSFFVYS